MAASLVLDRSCSKVISIPSASVLTKNDSCAKWSAHACPVFVNIQCVIVQAKIAVLNLMVSSFTAQVICVISVFSLGPIAVKDLSNLYNKAAGTVQTESEAEMCASLHLR